MRSEEFLSYGTAFHWHKEEELHSILQNFLFYFLTLTLLQLKEAKHRQHIHILNHPRFANITENTNARMTA